MGINFEKIYEDVEKTEKYQVKIKIPSTWNGENGYYNNNSVHITLEGGRALFRITDNFILDKNVGPLYDIHDMFDFENWNISEGTTKEGYSYIQYRQPDSPSYYFFMQISKEFIINFKLIWTLMI